MSNPNRLADQSQVTRLYDCLEMAGNMHGAAMGTGVIWSVAEVALPEAVLIRSEIEPEQAEGYGFVAFVPRLVQDEQMARLFRGTAIDTATATINFRQHQDVQVHSPKPGIQYRFRRDLATNLIQLDRLYIGEPVDFGVLDEEETRRRRETQAATLREELYDLPEDPSELSDEDTLRAIQAAGRLLGREFEEKWARREKSEELARSLGLTAVFSDEVESLTEFIGSLSIA